MEGKKIAESEADLGSIEWVLGETIGHGSFTKVDFAILKSGDGLMEVKSAPNYYSESLKHERQVLGLLVNSENVIRFFSDSFSCENGEWVYNVFPEYTTGGSVYDWVKRGGGGRLSEAKARNFTRSVLSGLKEVHAAGFVHCDVKLQNILLHSSNSANSENDFVTKIADFGLAKRRSRIRVAGNRDSFDMHEMRFP